MPRYFKKISLEDFKSKISDILDDAHDFFYDRITEKLLKDLSKVNFDFENCSVDTPYDKYLCGIQTLPNGMHCLFVNAVGDWEFPICFIVYWDGKILRGYIPSDGNAWNKKEKCAYGSEEEYDDTNKKDPATEVDNNKIIADIIARINEKN